MSTEKIEIVQIRQSMSDMGNKTVKAIHMAITALASSDLAIAAEVRELKKSVDAEYRVLDTLCVTALSRELDEESLHFLVGSLKIALDIERISDYANKIAKRVQRKFSRQDMSILVNEVEALEQLAEEADHMLAEALSAYEKSDGAVVKVLHDQERLVNRQSRELFKNLLCVASLNPWMQEQILDFYAVARYVERVADRSETIAEQICYITGEPSSLKSKKRWSVAEA